MTNHILANTDATAAERVGVIGVQYIQFWLNVAVYSSGKSQKDRVMNMRSKKIIPWVVALTLAGGSSAAMAGDTFNDALGGGLGGAIGAAVGGSMGGQTGAVVGGGLGGAGGAILAGKYNDHDDDHYRGHDWDHRRNVHYHRHDHGRHRGWDHHDRHH